MPQRVSEQQPSQDDEGKSSSVAKDERPSALRKPGRPRAKHSDKKNYAQMSLYIRREIRNRAKARLFERGLEFSALVESLLEKWLEEQGEVDA